MQSQQTRHCHIGQVRLCLQVSNDLTIVHFHSDRWQEKRRLFEPEQDGVPTLKWYGIMIDTGGKPHGTDTIRMYSLQKQLFEVWVTYEREK